MRVTLLLVVRDNFFEVCTSFHYMEEDFRKLTPVSAFFPGLWSVGLYSYCRNYQMQSGCQRTIGAIRAFSIA